MENASILNYKGNAELASGSAGDNGILNLGVLDTSPIIDSFRKVASRANEVADLNYKQKIADRDKIFNKLATLEIDLDKTLPEGRQRLQDKISEIEKLYVNNPDITSDKAAYIEMQKKMREFNELNAHAKTNYVTTTQDLLAASKIEDPDDRQKYLEHIKAQRDKIKENPYELYDPYPKPLKQNYDQMFQKVAPTKKVVKQGADFMDTFKTYTDPNQMLKNYQFDVVEGNNKSVRNQYEEFIDNYGKLKTPAERVQDFKSWNTKIDQANAHIADPSQKIKRIPFNEETGAPAFGEDFTKDDFGKAAYIAYRYNEGEGTEYNKGRADAEKLKAGIDVAKMKARTDAIYKAALGGAAKTKAGAYAAKLRAQVKQLKTVEEQDSLMDELYKRNLYNQSSLIMGKGNGRVSMKFIQADNSLPMFTFDGTKVAQLRPIGSRPVYSGSGASKKIVGYEGGHYEPIYMKDGKDVSASLGDMYVRFKETAKQKGFDWKGDMSDWMKESVKNDRLEFLLKGANGTTDRKLSLAAQRAISNADTKKGQDEVFEPIDNNVVDENEPE